MTLTTGSGWDAAAESRWPSGTLLWMVEIQYNGTNWHYMATQERTISATTWYNRVTSVSPVSYTMPEDQAYAALSRCSVRLRRGSITGSGDTMDDRYLVHTIHGKSAIIRANFTGTTNAVSFGNFIVSAARVANKGEIELELEADERVFVPIPTGLMGSYAGSTVYPHPIDFDPNAPFPIVIGDVLPQTTLTDLEMCNEPVATHLRLLSVRTDPGTDSVDGALYFALMENLGVITSYPYLLEYVSEWDAYALVLGVDGSTTTQTTWGVIKWADPNPPITVYIDGPANTAGSITRAAEGRILYVQPDNIYTESANSYHNTQTDWTTLPTAVTVASGDRISLVFSRRRGEPSDMKTLEAVYLHYRFENNTGTVASYKGTISTDSRASITSSSAAGPLVNRIAIGSETFDQSDRFWSIEVTGGSADISNVYLEFQYRSELQTTKRLAVWESAREIPFFTGFGGTPNNYMGRTFTMYDYARITTNKVPESNTIFAPAKGPTATIQPDATSYTHDTPPYCLYYLLNTVLGVSSTYLDATTFDAVYAYLVTDSGANFNTWNIGRQFMEQVNSLDAVRELCANCGMILHRGGDGKFKPYVINHAGSVVETFGDAKTDFPAWDFTVEYTNSFFNQFKFNYRWDPGRQKFLKSIYVDKDATVSTFLTGSKTACSNAYTNYGRELRAPDFDFYWFWEEETAENAAKIIINYMTRLRRRVRFKSKISAAKIEPGDTIRTDHQNQDWATGDVDFQVRSVIINPSDATVEIEALEINDL